jgi:hypothetical protein
MKFYRALLALAVTGVWPFQVPAIGGEFLFSTRQDSAGMNRLFEALKKGGKVYEGIRILDSLRVSGFSNEEFLGNYARYVFYAFMPVKKGSFSMLLKNEDQIQPTDTAFPCAFKWRIVSSPRLPLPFFEYRAGFIFRKQYKLIFSGLRPYAPRFAWLHYLEHEPMSAVSAALLAQLSDRTDSAWCTIHIDVNDTKISPYEYLIKRISGIYDSIEVRKDLSQYRAISIRCFNFGSIWRPKGTFTAYVVFDRRAMDIFKNDPSPRGKKTWKVDKTVRFTVTMRCCRDVESAAEAKLQSILRAF